VITVETDQKLVEHDCAMVYLKRSKWRGVGLPIAVSGSLAVFHILLLSLLKSKNYLLMKTKYIQYNQ
jgi:hypothetical protein